MGRVRMMLVGLCVIMGSCGGGAGDPADPQDVLGAIKEAVAESCPGAGEVLLMQQGITNQDQYGAYGQGDTNLLAIVTFAPGTLDPTAVECR